MRPTLLKNSKAGNNLFVFQAARVGRPSGFSNASQRRLPFQDSGRNRERISRGELFDHGNLLAENLFPELGRGFLAAKGDFTNELRAIRRHHRPGQEI